MPLTSIVITTRNRKEELRNALVSAMAQTAPLEVIVIDDASTDGTSEMVRDEFPGVRVHKSETARGLIVQRNFAAQLATAPVIVSLDDDAVFTSPHIVAQTLAAFDHPRVGAVTIPFIDVGHRPDVIGAAPNRSGIFITGAYIGAAHAVRRELFLRLGGYREYLFQYAEERDFCIRMLNAGYVTRLGTADLVHHFLSPKRQHSRGYIFRTRSFLLYPWYNAPTPYLPLHFAAAGVNMMRVGLRERHPIWTAWGIVRGCTASIHELPRRKPVTLGTYLLSQELMRRGCMPLAEAEGRLEPPAFGDLPPIPAADPSMVGQTSASAVGQTFLSASSPRVRDVPIPPSGLESPG